MKQLVEEGKKVSQAHEQGPAGHFSLYNVMRDLTYKVIHERLENSSSDLRFWIKTFK